MTDARLPQLDTILNAQAVRGSLAAACFDQASDWRIADCRVGHVRYKPGKNCLVRYDATLARRNGAETRTQMWYGLAYEPGGSQSRFEKAQRNAAKTHLSPEPAVAHLESLGMVLWAFPNDRKLRGLDIMPDGPRLSREVFSGAAGTASTEMIRYIPEHGCTVKLTSGAKRYFAKLTTAGDAETVCAHARALGREAWTTPLGISVQAEVPGAPANGADDLAQCALALARLHQQPLPDLAQPADPSGDVQMGRARALLASYASADSLLDQIANRRAIPSAQATLHGDLHVKNFLVSGDRAELIDLDTLHSGDPLDDIGSFAASLYHRALLSGAGVESADAAVNEFLRVYRSCVPWLLDDRDIATHVARALITERACRSITRCKGDVVDALLAIARRILYSNAVAAGPLVTARDWMEHFHAQARIRPGVVLDVDYRTFTKDRSWPKSSVTVVWRDGSGIHTERCSTERRNWDVPLNLDCVREHLPVSDSASVQVEVLNYRPGNRVTARYTVKTTNGATVELYGKTYADTRGEAIFERMTRLHQAGFPMPRPLGYSETIRTAWQESFRGTPLIESLGKTGEAELLSAAAARVAFLHASDLRCPARLTATDQHADLSKKLAKLATVVPEHRTRFERILRTLADGLDNLAPIEPGVIHGDLHIGQFMVREGQVALFDYDETSIGDPCEDLAAFIANLHATGLPHERVQQIGGTLLSAYATCRGARPLPDSRLRWHTAVQLLTRAYRALIQLKPVFDAVVERNLQLAEQCL